jgi:dTDP-4-amino-4,6-dideoxygalactose transaminase
MATSDQDEIIPFHRPSITDAEIEAATAVLRSAWLTTGRRAHALEAAFSERLGVRHALALNSATAGLHLALEAFGIGPGDEVVVPTYTFTACGEVCAYLGARPALVDVHEDDYLISPQAVADAVGPRTRAIIVVHFAGLAVDPGPLREALAGRQVRIVEDAAHAIPSSVGGIPVGRLGDVAVFSFYATKTMTTGGEGGMLVTQDDIIAERVARMRLHGISADAWNRYGAGGRWFYEVLDAGYKYNLTDLAAAIGEVQLSRVDEMAARRAEIARRYDDAFANSPLVELPPRREGDVHAWHLYVVRLNLELLSVDRGAVIEGLAQRGIGASVHFIPLHLHPYYQRAFGYRPGDFPVAERLYDRSISLPIWPDMDTRQVELVAGALLEVLDAARRPAVV